MMFDLLIVDSLSDPLNLEPESKIKNQQITNA